jgi:hypothetical protein
MLYLIRGPFKKDGRDYVVVRDGKKRRIMTYARFLYRKETGENLPSWVEIHHTDGDKTHEEFSNYEKQKSYKHKELHAKDKKTKSKDS